MNKKSVFSYFMWFLYSMAVCISLFTAAGTLSYQSGYGRAIGFGVCGLWLLLCGVMVFLVHRLVTSESPEEEERNKIPALIVESLLAVLLFAVGIALRSMGLSWAGEDAAYFEVTKVAEGQSIPMVVHGGVYIYLQLLHFVYVLFGNKFFAGVWLQIALLMIAGLFLYLAVRKMTGSVSALITLLFVMVGPVMVNESLFLSPEILFFAIYAILLLICVCCIRGRKKWISCLMAGVAISIACYLDILGITLLIFTVTGILFQKEEEDKVLSQRLLSAFFCIIGCSLGFVLLIGLDSVLSQKSFLSVLFAWGELYAPTKFILPAMTNIAYSGVDVLFLLLLLSIGVFSYWCNWRIEGQSTWIISGVSLILLHCFRMTTKELNPHVYLYIIVSVLAGISITSMFVYQNREEEPIEEEELREEMQKTEENPQVTLLENPLPLPKKHVKKVLDYDIKRIRSRDDYDLIVDENDDYDI